MFSKVAAASSAAPRKTRARIAWLVLSMLAIAGGAMLATHQSAQYRFYNAALTAENSGAPDKAIELYDRSIQSFQTESHDSWWHHMVFGRPSPEVAALAHFRKGVILLQIAMQQQKPGIMAEAVDEFKDSLRVNPGNSYAANVSAAQRYRLKEEAMVVKHDLDLLFEQHPEQQQAQGQGKGQGKSGAQGQKPSHDHNNDPGSKPGHGGDDGL